MNKDVFYSRWSVFLHLFLAEHGTKNLGIHLLVRSARRESRAEQMECKDTTSIVFTFSSSFQGRIGVRGTKRRGKVIGWLGGWLVVWILK